MNAQGHRLAQLQIRAAALRDAHRLWSTWVPGNLESWNRMVALAVPVVQSRSDTSSGVAGAYFRRETGSRPVLADPPVEEQIARSLAATGLVGVFRARSVGMSIEAAAQVGFVRFGGGFTRLALMGGRDTIVQSAAQHGMQWQRVTGGDPCAWCADQAGEGATDSEVYPSHDHCSCSVEPLT